jgi:hypothetical protein
MSTAAAQHKVCLKCDHVAIGIQPSPTAACPKCGAIYSKLEAQIGSKPTIPAYEAKSNKAESLEQNRANTLISLAITASVSVAIGYFWGASSPSYDTMMDKAYDTGILFEAGFKPLEGFALQSPSEINLNQDSLPISVSLLSLESHEDQNEFASIHQTLMASINVYNRSDNIITGITGLMSFYDSMNNHLYSTKMIINEAIMPHTSIEKWPFTFTMPAQKPEATALLRNTQIKGIFQPISYINNDNELIELY